MLLTYASSYIRLTASTTGGTAEQAAERKRAKYANLPATHDFIPLAIESLGPVNITGMEFLEDLGQRMTEAMGDPRETHSFILAISMAPLQVLYFSEALSTTARILYRSFTPKRTANWRERTCPRSLRGGFCLIFSFNIESV